MAKRKGKTIDYSDMIALAVRVLRRRRVRGLPYQHLLVDKYQDTSPLQALMFQQLPQRIPNIMVVGDPNQAIYGFAGATYTPLSTLVPDVQVLPLARSWRLTSRTVRFVRELLAANADGLRAELPALELRGRPGGVKPVLLRVDSEARQASAVAQRVQQLISEGAAPPDIAVLSRIRQHLLPVERSLWALDLPATRQGTAPHLKHVQAVLQLVLCIYKPFDTQDIAKALLPRELGKGTLGRVFMACKIAAKSSSLEGQFIGCGKAYLKALGGMRNNKDANHAINAWAPMCRKYKSARAMLKALISMSGTQGVTTSTIHQAKGKEWKHVIVVGCTEGVLPDYRATSEAKRLEELNTLYVAATRASETLTLVHAPHTIVRRHNPAIEAQELSSLLDHQSVLRYLTEKRISET